MPYRNKSLLQIARDQSCGTRAGGAKKPIKPRKCKACQTVFEPWTTMQRACSVECAIKFAERERAKRDALAARKERKEIQRRKEKIKNRSDWIRDAQIAFNAFIRERDRLAGYPCISSGLPLDWSGNNVDAGHYRSRGAAPHLRFNEDNCHAQSKKENRYGSGNAVDYRINLIKRIGLARVEALEADNADQKWTIEELKEIRNKYRAKLGELKAGVAAK